MIKAVEALWLVEVVEELVEAVVDTTEKGQMGMRRKNNWEAGRKTILEADDASDLKEMLENFIGLRYLTVCCVYSHVTRQIKTPRHE